MNDLISRQAVIENIRKYADKKCCNGEIELANGILKSLSIIKKQPTAYDVDKVVYQLQENTHCDSERCYFIPEETIRIVKRGGIE